MTASHRVVGVRFASPLSMLARGGTMVAAIAVLAGCSGGPSGTATITPTARTGSAAVSSAGASVSVGTTTPISSTTPASPPVTPSAHLSAALAVLPSDATTLWFTDDAAMKERLGLGDVTSQTPTSSPEFQAYVQASQNVPVNGLGPYTFAMARDWGWSGLDVDWSAMNTEDGSPPVTVYSLRSDLDMTVVTTSLTDNGYVRSGTDERPDFAVDLKNPPSPMPFLRVVVIPDEHLLVAGGKSDHLDAVLDAIDGTAPSLASNPDVTQLTDAIPAPEFESLTVGEAACVDPTRAVAGHPPSGSISALVTSAAPGLAGTHPVTGAAVATLDDQHAVVAVSFADAGQAAADATVRAEMMASGRTVSTRMPYSQLFTVDSTTISGPVVSYHLTLQRHARQMADLVARLDTPWAYCA